MKEIREEDVVIVGGGVAGLATALALKRVGVGSLVLERSEGLRASGSALTLAPNAWLALDALGVAHKLTPLYAPFHKGYFTNVRTKAIQEFYFRDADGSKPRTIHRRALLEALAGELPPETIRFSSKLSSFQTQSQDNGASSISVIHLEDGTIIKAKVLIGCDGVHSVVARWLGLSDVVHSGRSAVRGLAEYPQGHGLKHEVQQFVDVGKRGGFLPISDHTVYWFLCFKSTLKGEEVGAQGDPEWIQREVLDRLAHDFPPVYKEVVQHSDLATLSWAPLVFRVPWNVIFGDLSRGSITVAGDAMHPMTPDLGQGGCLALEDAVVLGRHIGRSFIENDSRVVPGEAAKALEGYARERRWRAAQLITGSYISGWVQQDVSGWLMRFLRDVIFYRFLFRFLLSRVDYDCGRLPAPHPPRSDEEILHNPTKVDHMVD